MYICTKLVNVNERKRLSRSKMKRKTLIWSFHFPFCYLPRRLFLICEYQLMIEYLTNILHINHCKNIIKKILPADLPIISIAIRKNQRGNPLRIQNTLGLVFKHERFKSLCASLSYFSLFTKLLAGLSNDLRVITCQITRSLH